jgi:hypothetical protein
MRLVQIDGEKFLFEFAPQEMDLLIFVLNDYPLVPEAHHRLHKTEAPGQQDDQKLLEDALKAQRQANKAQLQALLKEDARFARSEKGFQAAFNRGEIEMLLQILNDVRIGSWIALGSPGYDEEEKYVEDKKSIRCFMTMQICAGFQSLLLQSLHREAPPAKE